MHHKFWKRAAAVLILGTFGVLFSADWLAGRRTNNNAKNVKRNHLKTGLGQFVNVSLDQDNEQWLQFVISKSLPGKLICQRANARSKGAIQLMKSDGTRTHGKIDLSGAPSKGSSRKVSISKLSPTKTVGCCPAGHPFGKVYRTGFACCVDKVFDVLTHFCCSTNFRLLPLTLQNLDYCHPPDDIQYCRETDLEMEQKWPMTHSCVNNSRNTPETCRFSCPIGSLPKDEISETKCSKNGTWDMSPTCCQGCPKSFKLDVWFLIQVPKNQDRKNTSFLKDFLKTLLSYLPISQDTVRVGFDLISSRRHIDTAVWDLMSHENHEDANSNIDILSFQGFGAKVGKALTWLGQNGFSRTFGDREGVENLVIPILYDSPEDSILESARTLKEVATVVPIAIGHGFSDKDLSVIASSRNISYRLEKSDELNSFDLTLHKLICGEACVSRVTRKIP